MSSNSGTLPRLVWGGLAALVLFIGVAFSAQKLRERSLDIGRPLHVISQIQDFNLTNHLGQAVTLDDFLGEVWIADIIFTRCPGPCARMSRRMEAIQKALPPTLPVRLVSLTTDPSYDTPDVLQAYGKRYHADPERWWFLTGDEANLGRLAMQGLKLAVQEKEESDREVPEDLFIHSTLIVVVDRQGRLRAAFESLPRAEDDTGDPVNLEDSFGPTRDDIIKVAMLLQRENRLLTLQDLPAVNAGLNGLSALLLLAGFVFIKRGNKVSHQQCMVGALISSTLFLASYLTYHALVGHTSFRDPAWFRPWYLALLVSHVLLAAAIVPLVLVTATRAFRERFEAHKKIARWTWPLWMYVSVTGVMIYFILYWIFPQG